MRSAYFRRVHLSDSPRAKYRPRDFALEWTPGAGVTPAAHRAGDLMVRVPWRPVLPTLSAPPGAAPLPVGDKIEHTVTISPREYYIHGRKRI